MRETEGKLYKKPANSFCLCLEDRNDGLLKCNCGEDCNVFHWVWNSVDNSSTVIISNLKRDVMFHPTFSTGTALIKGDKPFAQNMHHFWEFKVISTLYGTDVMIGVGTKKVDIESGRYKFSSLLGLSDQSWGYSYHGNIQHNKVWSNYSPEFGIGCLIGVHLDLVEGSLEYYLNRKPLGVAFQGLKGLELYPMLSSTAAQSVLRLTNSISVQPSLKLNCLLYIVKNPSIYNEYKSIPGLEKIHERRFFWLEFDRNKNEEKMKKRKYLTIHEFIIQLNKRIK